MIKNSQKEKLVLALYEIGAIKFGKFKLKSGKISPFYLDLRFLCSYPEVLKLVASSINEILNDLKYDLIVGIPYTGIPIATAVALQYDKKMIFTRKEAKDHGIQRMIEGIYKKGQRSVLIDDVIADGASKFEVIEPLEKEGLVVKDVIVILDRGQGGADIMKKRGYNLHSALNIEEVISILRSKGKISTKQVAEIRAFLSSL